MPHGHNLCHWCTILWIKEAGIKYHVHFKSPKSPQSKAGNKQPLFVELTSACFLQGGENMQDEKKKQTKFQAQA